MSYGVEINPILVPQPLVVSKEEDAMTDKIEEVKKILVDWSLTLNNVDKYAEEICQLFEPKPDGLLLSDDEIKQVWLAALKKTDAVYSDSVDPNLLFRLRAIVSKCQERENE